MACFLVVCCTSRTRGSGLYVSDLEKEANRYLKQDELGLSTFGKVGIAFGTIFILLVALLLQRVYCPYRSGLTTFKIIFLNSSISKTIWKKFCIFTVWRSRFTSNRTSGRSSNEDQPTNRSTSLPSAPNPPPYDDMPPSYESLTDIKKN